MNSWRKKLLWRTDLIDDIDYWLQYSESPYSNHYTEEFTTDAAKATMHAVKFWDANADEFGDKVTNDQIAQVREFAQKFIEQHGSVNAEILLAYIMQAT